MAAAPFTARRQFSPGAVYAITCAIIVGIVIAIIVAWGAWSSRKHQLSDKAAATLDLSQALALHAHAMIKQADIVLFGLVERLEADGLGVSQLARLEKLLRGQKAQLSQLHGLFVYDSQGRWLVNSNGAAPPGANNSDRGYFTFHRDHADAKPYIGPPVRSRSSGEWILTVSRRLNHRDGTFAGVALATINLTHFGALYETLDIGNNGAVSLLLDDGTILLRRPFRDEDVGTSIANGSLFSRYLKDTNHGTATVDSVLDGVQRLLGFTRIKEYGLVAYVARDKQEILAEWRKESLFAIGFVTLFMMVLALLGSRLLDLMKVQIRVEQDLRDAQDGLIQANRSLKVLAREDGLTGLANRREFDSVIQAEFKRAKRSGSLMAVLMLDVDFFKKYNDHYGHPAGDDCLKKVGRILRENTNRQSDLAARYGGEEFIVVLTDTTIDGARIVAEKIRSAVQREAVPHVESPLGVLTASIGVAVLHPTADDEPAVLITMADKALYQAKNSGRNCSFSFSGDSQF
ncbi:diguanylate cyclase [Candidimonas sp. SYP-B2681]|uniref:sensor domain-containing diguanylate cyclase n=1 Tax=Candidimonas sp. SYP-B2681 TaxID=2497686 RepID=UPI000F89B0DF|nr:GGDEF domain-containing protein [Candidimonas sp. SYP-B2681]RTZ47860.1 diguanylate cyclase [Candidimonas sp. SYP-B2681]